jgi:hypothetical protein
VSDLMAFAPNREHPGDVGFSSKTALLPSGALTPCTAERPALGPARASAVVCRKNLRGAETESFARRSLPPFSPLRAAPSRWRPHDRLASSRPARDRMITFVEILVFASPEIGGPLQR